VKCYSEIKAFLSKMLRNAVTELPTQQRFCVRLLGIDTRTRKRKKAKNKFPNGKAGIRNANDNGN